MNYGGSSLAVSTWTRRRRRSIVSSLTRTTRSIVNSTTTTLIEAVRKLQSKELSSEALINQCYERAVEGQELWNTYTYMCPYEDVLSQAKASDQRRQGVAASNNSSGSILSPLDGIPVSIKSNIAVCGLPFTAASQMLTNTATTRDCIKNVTTNISPYDAYITTKLLRDAGAILIGLTNMDEFGMGSWGTSSPIYGPTYNPYSTDNTSLLLSAGGSSSGAAVSVASGSCLLAIGTDTGGSIRLPASWCGVSGFKPTYGLISRHGIISYASSLDTVGWIAPTPQCCAFALPFLVNTASSISTNTTSTMTNGSEDDMDNRRISCGDSTATFYFYNNQRNHNHREQLQQHKDQNQEPFSLQGIKVGIPAAFSVDPCPPYIKALWNKAAKLLVEKGGADVVIVPTTVVTPATIKASLSSYYVLACAEASSNLARFDGLRYGTNYHELLSSWNKLRSPKRGPPSLYVEEDEYSNTPKENDVVDNDEYDDDLSLAVHQQYSATRALGFGPEVVRRILAGTAVLSSDRFHTHYEAAAKQRVILRREFNAAFFNKKATNTTNVATDVNDSGTFSGVDVMLVPTSLSLPCLLGSRSKPQNSEEYEKINMDMLSSDIMTVPLSLAGLPTMSVPVKLVLPLDGTESQKSDQEKAKIAKSYDVHGKIKSLGMQVFGPPMSEDLVMKVSLFIYENDKE